MTEPGWCSDCDKVRVSGPFKTCEGCRAFVRAWQRANAEKRRTNQRRYWRRRGKARRRAWADSLQCRYCGSRRLETLTMCKKHAEERRRENLRRWVRRHGGKQPRVQRCSICGEHETHRNSVRCPVRRRAELAAYATARLDV